MLVPHQELSRLAGRVTMVDGCFDPLHGGHLAYFREAAALGRPLLANVQDDGYIRNVKGRANLLPEEERASLLEALADVAYVHLCHTSTLDVLRQLRPACYAKGADWRGLLPEEQVELCREFGIRVRFVDASLGSSTDLVSRFLARQEAALIRSSPRLESEPPSDPPYEAVVTSHTNPYLSGVAKFSRLLAARLGAPCRPLAAARSLGGPVLVSLKLSDARPEDLAMARAALASLTVRHVSFDLFLHAYESSPEERAWAGRARRVLAGNAEMARRLAGDGLAAEESFCPPLLDEARPVTESELKLFSFGMAHKMRIGAYERLRDLLDGTGRDYSLTVSTAFHERASFGEIDEITDGFTRVFGDRVSLLGFLSDAAVRHFLARAHAFVAFFPSGVRDNNTSVLAAMATGRVVITNLDADSPSWMRHGENVLDISRLAPGQLESVTLLHLGPAARDAVEANASWNALAGRLLGAEHPVAAGAVKSGRSDTAP